MLQILSQVGRKSTLIFWEKNLVSVVQVSKKAPLRFSQKSRLDFASSFILSLEPLFLNLADAPKIYENK